MLMHFALSILQPLHTCFLQLAAAVPIALMNKIAQLIIHSTIAAATSIQST